MVTILINIIKVVFLLGFLIFIHEGGHFLVSKLCNVKVNEFAIGFGPAIWKKKIGETKYALRIIPLGGFVNLEGEDEYSEDKRSYSKASIPKRIAILIAGGTVNIIFGLLVYFILSASMGNFITNIVQDTIDGYVAQQVGIMQGDKIIKVNGKTVRNQADLTKEIQKTNGEETNITYIRDGKKQNINIIPTKEESKNIGIYFDESNKEPIIVSIYPGSVAERVGIKAKDRLIKVNGIDVSTDVYRAIEEINNLKEGTLNLTVQRNDSNIELQMVPETVYMYYLGVNLQKSDNNFINNVYYAFWNTVDFSISIVDNLKSLFSGNVSVNQLVGPVGISDIVVETEGINEYIYLLALISLSLGITNLLPFPPLDGGKILFLLIEAIRRKPLKENTEFAIQSAGFFILILLSVFIAYNDILRIF